MVELQNFLNALRNYGIHYYSPHTKSDTEYSQSILILNAFCFSNNFLLLFLCMALYIVVL